jgi:hypothetical protein
VIFKSQIPESESNSDTIKFTIPEGHGTGISLNKIYGCRIQAKSLLPGDIQHMRIQIQRGNFYRFNGCPADADGQVTCPTAKI